MPEPRITIRIGAQVDRGLDVALRSVEQSARRASATVSTSFKGTEESSKRVRRGVRDVEKEYAELEKWATRAQHGIDASMSSGTRAVVRFGTESKRSFDQVKNSFGQLARETERDMARIEAAQRKAQVPWLGRKFGVSASLERTRIDPISSLAGVGRRAVGAGVGIMRDLARGAGVETNLGALMGQNVELEKQAVQLANAAFIPGARGAAGVRQDPRELMREARAVGNQTALDPRAALEGLTKFVAKTGDLETGREVLADMAKLAAATGTELDDMVDAAGDVSSTFGEMPNKAEAVKDAMRIIAAQGKLGAVEIKNLATQMAKVASASGQFGFDRKQSLIEFGALAQMSRARGGSASAAQAATSLMSLMAQFSKGKRVEHMEGFGVRIQENNRNRSIRDLIVDMLKAAEKHAGGTGMQFDRNMRLMIQDAQAVRATKPFETMFKEAGGGEAGARKVQEAFDNLTRASLSRQEIENAFNLHMQTSTAQVQLFNNKMSETADQLRTSLLPAISALAPHIVALANAASSAISKLMGGTKEEEDRRAMMGVQTTQHGARMNVLRGIKTGTLDDKDVELLKRGQGELDVQIAKRQQDKVELSKPRATDDPRSGWFWASLLSGSKVASMAVEKGAGIDSEESRATQLAQANEDIKRMRDDQEKGRTLLETSNKVLKDIHEELRKQNKDGPKAAPPPTPAEQ